MKVQESSKSTKKALQTLQEIKTPVAKHIVQTKEEEEKVGYVIQRREKMRQKRSVEDKKWKTYIKQYESIFVPYADGRASSNVPLERAIIELFVSEAIKRPTTYNFNGAIGYDFQERILEKVWKRDWSVNNRGSEILNNEYLTAMFGTSVLFTGYEKKYRVIEDFDGEDENGKIKFDRKLEIKSNILLDNVDIRDFYVDDKTTNIDNAIDCVYETYIPYEEFLNYKLDGEYDKKKLEAIIPNKSKFDNNRAFIYQEERGDTETRFIKITKYWNVALDRYFEIANEKILIKEHPILNASHSLPFIVRQYGKNLFSVYGYGLCEALLTFKSDINKLREMLMEAIKKSNQEAIAIGSNLTFDGNQFAYNNQFLKFKGNLQGNFHQLSGTPPNQAIFTYLQELFKQIAIFCGIDIMNILGEPQQTAYQTAVQKESSLQRVNVVLKNRDEAFERLANLHKDNLQMFYPLKIVRGLIRVNQENKPIEPVEEKYPEIEVPKMKGKRFMKGKEKQLFEVKPEDIRGDIKIDVSTDLNAPTITEVEKEQKMQFFTQVANLTQAYANNPTLEQIIPMKKAIKDMAKLNNIDMEESYDGEVVEKKKELYNELQEMMKGVRAPVEQESATEELAKVSPEGQPPEIENVRTPNI